MKHALIISLSVLALAACSKPAAKSGDAAAAAGDSATPVAARLIDQPVAQPISKPIFPLGS